MGKTVIAINGSYRRGGITDQTVEEILRAVRDNGGQAETIDLRDVPLEFCTNCRSCTQKPAPLPRGQCIHNDAMSGILDRVDAADKIVLASPINFYNCTALTRRFFERLVVYAYWPWGYPRGPKERSAGKLTKRAVLATSTACPAAIARRLIPSATKAMKAAARCMGARVVDTVWQGMIANAEKQRLTDKQRKRAYQAGEKLMR
jgi:multimeric flavodoxin WrbA